MTKTYSVEITETLQRTVDIEAESYQEAFRQVNKSYKDGDIILDSSDFVDYEISMLTAEERNVNRIRKEYPVGTRIKLIHMSDPFHPVPPNTIGTVAGVDDMGTIHMSWENGSSLGIIPNEDSFIKLDHPSKKKNKENER